MSVFIQILLIICIISVVCMGLVSWFAYDQQLRRREAFEQEQEERKKGNPFLF